MKTILEVSLQEASKAKDAIRYSLLRTELNQTSTNVWELPTYDMNDGYECDGDEELKDEIRELFSSFGIAEEEYSFTYLVSAGTSNKISKCQKREIKPLYNN